MLNRILSHQWKEATRAAAWQNHLVMNIIMGIVLFFMVLNLGVLGFFLHKILEAAVPGQEVVLTFNKAIIYYLGIDLVLRFFMQQVPVLAVQPYLHLPVKKSKLVHFVLGKSVLSFSNVLPLLVALPFAFQAVLPAYGLLPALAWSAGFISLVLFNNFLNLYLKRQLTLKPVVFLLLAAGLAGLAGLEYQGIFRLSSLTENSFATLLAQPAMWFLLPLLPVVMYTFNYQLLRRNMYLSELESATASVTNVHEFAFLKKLGAAGNLLALEMKLIWRNKRPRSLFISSLFMVAYGGVLIIMKDPQEENVPDSIMLIFAGVLTTGACMLYYGQYLHSWDANYFDTLMTKNISPYQYYHSKFLLFIGMCTIALLLSLGLAILDWRVLPLNFALYLYNIGVNAFVVLLLGVYDAKKIDLTKNAAFSWQGLGVVQYFIMLPLILGPVLLYLPFYMLEQSDLGLTMLAALGITGLVFHKPILKKLAKRLKSRKYKMAAAFRAA
ncbi:hypothetical protein I5M27_10725 [Adhaeribacter sp. BT258]|uniref:ABC transporter permease n=1 Tax=Adhaeribacter terrigena TaxID=2793070 RepID=A0ABS1C4K5_9BACT|nr:DUF5687 family protein [Adhaeribacter terrigena]MBK0403460.1 hypothetical protein [Adhaeribacter terrigena]